jgi:hypothetical protein
MPWVFVVILVGLLPGCAQFEAQKDREALEATVAMATNDDELCRADGVKPGTPSYVDCRLNLSNQRAAAAQRQGDKQMLVTPPNGRDEIAPRHLGFGQ